MKSDFCKSDPNHRARWFEMRFKSFSYRCIFSPNALFVQIGYQSVSCVTWWILGALMECLDAQEGCSMATDSDKCPVAHLKSYTPPLIIKCPKDGMFLILTALCGAQTSCYTVKPAMTVAQNIVMLIGLFRRVCRVRWTSAPPPQLSSPSVWIVRWCIYIFQIIVLPHCKAAHQRTYWCLRCYHSNPCREVSTVWCLNVTNPIWSLANESVDSVKNQIWETKQTACSLNKA